MEKYAKKCAMTHHVAKRLTERTGCNYATAGHIATTAYYYGETSDAYTGKEKDYLKNKESKRAGSQVKVFAGCCFVYMPDTTAVYAAVCVTAFTVPGWFNKKTPSKPYKARTASKGVPVKKTKKYAKLTGYYNTSRKNDKYEEYA